MPAALPLPLRKTVAYDKEARAWAVHVRHDHVVVQLGGYSTPEEASWAGDALVGVILLPACPAIRPDTSSEARAWAVPLPHSTAQHSTAQHGPSGSAKEPP